MIHIIIIVHSINNIINIIIHIIIKIIKQKFPHKKTGSLFLIFDMIVKRTAGFILDGKIISTVAQTVAGYVGKGRVAT